MNTESIVLTWHCTVGNLGKALLSNWPIVGAVIDQMLPFFWCAHLKSGS